MLDCKLCKSHISDSEGYCRACGYDPKTDTISQSFKPGVFSPKDGKGRAVSNAERRSQGVSPGVKKMLFIGVGLAIFSILYKYNFNPMGLVMEAEQLKNSVMLASGKAGKLKPKPKPKSKLGKNASFNEILTSSVVAEKPKKPANLPFPDSLSLQGILWGVSGSQAIINDTVVKVGDSIEGAQIAEINQSSVILLRDNQKYTISISKK